MDLVHALNYFVAFFSVYVVVFYFLLLFTYKKNYEEEPPIDENFTPLVSIIVPAYNEEKYIGKCLQTLLELDYPKDKLDIIVINDGSTDLTEEEAKKFEKYGVRVVTQKNAGKGAALNHGLKIAKGEFIVTMDADSYVLPKTLKQLLAFFKDDPEVMAVTPAIKIRPSNSLLVELQRIEYLMIIFSRKLLSFIDAVPVTPGPFSIFRASVFKKVGGFDEHNLVEDQEIALRIQKHHFKIRSSVKAEVYTNPPETIQDLIKQRVRWQRGGVRNYWNYKHLITPEYGDFGLFFVPLNFITLASFFIVLGLMINAIVNTPYYVSYIFIESIGMGINPISVPLFFAGLASVAWLALVLGSFKNEKVGIIPIILYYFFYWYLMLCYNLLLVYKELKHEKFSW
ncbi:MAG: glycosyltransferase [Candidatus Bilamarchaeaceae archaeon]